MRQVVVIGARRSVLRACVPVLRAVAPLPLPSLSHILSPLHITRSSPYVPRASFAAQAQPRPSTSSSSSSSSSSSTPARIVRDHVAEGNFTRSDCGLWVDRSLPPTFKKILIANRGEIACRVIRTARLLGIKTVAVYSDADAKAMHVQMADEAYRLGESAATKSYLLGDKILEICKISGAQAVHPGYGFLSENAAFADQCAKAGVVFIGPPAGAILSMGSKSASKNIMTAAGVPVVPGYHGEAQDVPTLRKEAERCGYPIMLKAVSGGGGKGMRIVRSAAEFDEALAACKREALNSFKDDRVLLERYIERPRHIEFQVFADTHGNAVHLYERDCSVQRRHQKVLEEAPAPGMAPELRAKMGKSATDAAKAVGYVGAGTVEFIFDAETDEYFFMEMNTRLQVEHPVTEMIMRRDLVQWQLHVAAGNVIPEEQHNIAAKGHALEARIYAENPRNNFLPCTGRLVHLRSPTNAYDLRVETGVRHGDEVSIFYDPMIAKLVVWGEDRKAALKRMSVALEQYQIVGPPTNVAFLQRAVAHPAFEKGRVETGFIPQNIGDLLPKLSATAPAHIAALAVASLLQREAQEAARVGAASTDPVSPWHAPAGFRVGGAAPRAITIFRTNPQSSVEEENKKVATNVRVTARADGAFDYSFDDAPALRVQTLSSDPTEISALVGENLYRATVVRDGLEVHVFVGGVKTQFTLPSMIYGRGERTGDGAIAPMAGKVVKVFVTAKQAVKKGESLVIMEAMKMEHVIKAAHDGVISAVHYQTGDFVEGGKLLVAFETPAKK